MGGAGLALGDPYYINNTNPASYSNIKLTTFELGFMTNYITQEQREPAVKVENSNAGMRYFSFAIPVLDRWGSAVGLQPYTARGYDIFGTRIGPDSITVQDRYTGSGGISKVYWGNSFAVLRQFFRGY
ncbi:MAG: hypothetical protein U5L96_11740 [Owenweeksia sp.]|nr:hypothetical protein [Owenweeksia sp.]